MKRIRAYKVFNRDWTCLNFQYEVGKEYTIDGDIGLCSRGFHACVKAVECFSYYPFNPDNKVAEVELFGNVLGLDGDKQCSSGIKIVREIKWNEVFEIVNTGKNNTGINNVGNRNTGNRNTGNRNTGHWNTGDCNTGDCNTGDCNTGNWNTGNRNAGDWNTGQWNTGNWNTGHKNTGQWNTGNWNTGNRNAGDWNTGNRNTGHWNTGDRNSGFLNTRSNLMYMFNKPVIEDDRNNIDFPSFFYFDVNVWHGSCDMTDGEKSQHPEHETTGGYMQQLDYKTAWQASYSRASQEDIAKCFSLPNWDAEVFYEISGIDLRNDPRNKK